MEASRPRGQHNPPLMVRIGEAEEKADRDRAHIGQLQQFNRLVDRRVIERNKLVAKLVESLGHLHTQVARYQRGLPLDPNRVELRPSLPPNLEHVSKSLGRYQPSSDALALQHGIGCDRRTMDERTEVVPRAKLIQSLQNRTCRIVRRGQNLVNADPASVQQNEIGEGPSGVDANQSLCHPIPICVLFAQAHHDALNVLGHLATSMTVDLIPDFADSGALLSPTNTPVDRLYAQPSTADRNHQCLVRSLIQQTDWSLKAFLTAHHHGPRVNSDFTRSGWDTGACTRGSENRTKSRK